MSTPNPLIAMTAGIDLADGTEKSQEKALVKKWKRQINDTLAFDDNARRNYVKCRRYARGDSGFQVDANIVGTNIDILEAFIYAKNPDVDVTPSSAVGMPSDEVLIEAAMLAAEEDPELNRQVELASMVLANQVELEGKGPEELEQAKLALRQQLVSQKAEAHLATMKDNFNKTRREAKEFSETLELVISRAWMDARLKDRGRPWVRSALTIGLGVLKATWQERTAPSPETQTAINDLMANIAQARALRVEIEDEAAGYENEVKVAELERQVAAIRAKAEEVVAKGFAVDCVAGQNFLVAPGWRIADHMDAPWNAERIPMPMDEIVANFRLTQDQKAKVTKYMARKPVISEKSSANAEEAADMGNGVDPLLAEEFVKGEAQSSGDYGASPVNFGGSLDSSGAGCFGMVWEIWDRLSNTVFTWVEGLETWAKAPWTPPATTRFYPYFLNCTSEVDGQRHPQSPVERSAKLVDEYNRIGSAEALHRRRIIPKTMFNAGAMPDTEAEKVERAGTQEMVAVKLTNPAGDLRAVFVPVTYAAIDPALYDRTRINQEIERIWGVQEALGGSINTPKTATEADIQQQGFNARTGSRRDTIESALSHMALYTAEITRAFMSYEDVKEIAGPNAFWPAYEGPKDLRRMVDVDIRAGSTGKPNTRSDREAWGMLLPQIMSGIDRYAQLTGASPMDHAESIKKLTRITAERAGDRLDIDSLFPPPGMGPMPVGPDGQPMPAPVGAPTDAAPIEPPGGAAAIPEGAQA